MKLLVENPTSILSPRQSHGVSILTGMTDPFLYNPRRAFASQVNLSLQVAVPKSSQLSIAGTNISGKE